MVKTLFVVCSIVWVACGQDSLSIDLSNPAVELDVFSGRPNPRWQLTAAESSQLEDRLTGLPETSQAAIPDNLGYRGFRIEDDASSDRITVTSNGYVVVRHNNRDQFYRDTKGVEAWLLEQAHARGYGQLLVEARTRPRKR